MAEEVLFIVIVFQAIVGTITISKGFSAGKKIPHARDMKNYLFFFL